jgi:hypothetical protein
VWSHDDDDDDDDDDDVTGCPGKNKDSSRLANCADRKCPTFICKVQHSCWTQSVSNYTTAFVANNLNPD